MDLDSEFVFNVSPTASVIWGHGHGLGSHPTDRKSPGWKTPGYEASGLSTTPQQLISWVDPY